MTTTHKKLLLLLFLFSSSLKADFVIKSIKKPSRFYLIQDKIFKGLENNGHRKATFVAIKKNIGRYIPNRFSQQDYWKLLIKIWDNLDLNFLLCPHR